MNLQRYDPTSQVASTTFEDFRWARDMMLANRGDASTNVAAIQANVEKYGPAPGAKKMLDWEREAAELAIKTGVYTVWRNVETKQECTRVGPNSRCFCGHLYKTHAEGGGKCRGPKGEPCACKYFEFIPRRPEEVGEWWLPRRKGFNVHEWRAKCRCKHSHGDHMGGANVMRRCQAPDCGCGCFQSDFLCVVCDRHWEDHETHSEGAGERRQAGRPIGDAFFPLADTPAIQKLVFGEFLTEMGMYGMGAGAGAVAPFEHKSEDMQLSAMRETWNSQSEKLRPTNPMDKPERSVRLTATNAGGRAAVKTDRRYKLKEEDREGALAGIDDEAAAEVLDEVGEARAEAAEAEAADDDVVDGFRGFSIHPAAGGDGGASSSAVGGDGGASSSTSQSLWEHMGGPRNCTECGAPAERETAKFCGDCGTKLA